MTLLAFTVWLFALMTKGHWRHHLPPHCCELVPTSNLPILCHHRLMFANLNENPRKSGMWGVGGARSLLKMPVEKSFSRVIENFKFCLVGTDPG